MRAWLIRHAALWQLGPLVGGSGSKRLEATARTSASGSASIRAASGCKPRAPPPGHPVPAPLPRGRVAESGGAPVEPVLPGESRLLTFIFTPLTTRSSDGHEDAAETLATPVAVQEPPEGADSRPRSARQVRLQPSLLPARPPRPSLRGPPSASRRGRHSCPGPSGVLLLSRHLPRVYRGVPSLSQLD